MNNFWQRTLTGAFLVSAIIGATLGGFWTFSGLFFIISLMGLVEFYRMASPKQKKYDYVPALVSASAIYILFGLTASRVLEFKWLEMIIPVVAYFFLIELYRHHGQTKPFEKIAITFMGFIYVTMPFSLLNNLYFLPDDTANYEIVLGIFLFLWTSDTGAYLVGRSMGKRKLFERISPNKTIEGSMGGAILAMSMAWFGISPYFTSLSRIDWMFVALIVSISGIYGDLLESLLKRSNEVKDSGTILPGHGGILDRFDSLLFSAPLVYAYVRIVSV